MDLAKRIGIYCNLSESSFRKFANALPIDTITLCEWIDGKVPIPESFHEAVESALNLLCEIDRRSEIPDPADLTAYHNLLLGRIADKEAELIERFNGFLIKFDLLSIEERAAIQAYVLVLLRESGKYVLRETDENWPMPNVDAPGFPMAG